MVKKYGQTVMLTEDPALETYLDRILKQVNSAYTEVAYSVSNAANYSLVAQRKRHPTRPRPPLKGHPDPARALDL